MPYRLVWDTRGRAELSGLPPAPKRMLRRALRDFETLRLRRTKPLRGYPGRYTATVGDYRIILAEMDTAGHYRIELIAHRAVAYDDYPPPALND